MIVLGLETSSRICSVGLAGDRGPSDVLSLDAGSVHSEKLLTLIGTLLTTHSMSLKSIDAIAVSSGPGSFTGLRIGFSAAKGLCRSMGKPLVVVSTFEAVVWSVLRTRTLSGNIIVALDAKKGDFYVGTFRQAGREVNPEGRIQLLRAEELPGLVHPPSVHLFITEDRKSVV